MIDQHKRISTADFNGMVETNRPNIIAYAMMLSAGDRDRNSMVLLSMTAIWKTKKNYHPSDGVGFDQWCYQQIASEYSSVSDKLGLNRDLAMIVSDEAAAYLPANKIRMAAFDRAFFGLSKAEKALLSINCQHPRFQGKYIRDQKGLDRDGYDRQVHRLKSALLLKAAWKGSFVDRGDIASSEHLPMQRLAAGTLSADEVTIYQNKLINDRILRRYYYSCVSLQQALITRLQDEPSSELREGDDYSHEKRKRKRVILIALIALLLPPLYASTKDDGYLHRGVNKVVYSVVPEPSSISLIGVGLLSLIMRRSRDPH